MPSDLHDTERSIKEAEATITRLQEKFAKERKAWEEAKRAKGTAGY